MTFELRVWRLGASERTVDRMCDGSPPLPPNSGYIWQAKAMYHLAQISSDVHAFSTKECTSPLVQRAGGHRRSARTGVLGSNGFGGFETVSNHGGAVGISLLSVPSSGARFVNV
jgi:hypothetical protein